MKGFSTPRYTEEQVSHHPHSTTICWHTGPPHEPTVYCKVEKTSMDSGFRVLKFQLSLLLYFSQVCLHCLSKVPDSQSLHSLCLCPSHHFGSSLYFYLYNSTSFNIIWAQALFTASYGRDPISIPYSQMRKVQFILSAQAHTTRKCLSPKPCYSYPGSPSLEVG
jgi:hypothetical protein